MKTEELTKLGLSEEQVNQVLAMNGRDINPLKEQIKTLEHDKDEYKEKFEKADATIKDLESQDVETVKKEYEKKIEDLQKEHQKKEDERTYSDLVDAAVAELEFTSISAKKAFVADLKADPLKVKNGVLLGFSDFVNAYKESDASAFVDKESEESKGNAARFTGGKAKDKDETMTKEDILKITDRAERQAAMAEHIDLFQ